MQKRAEKQGGAPPSGGPPDGGLADGMQMLRAGVVHVRPPANDNPMGPWRRLTQPKVLLLMAGLLILGFWAVTR